MSRAKLKEASLQRILDAAAGRLRQEGLSGAAIADVMRDAGLTHGAFYVHFSNKSELARAALCHALKTNRSRWIGALRSESWGERLQRLARRYLTRAHRDHPENGCALAAIATEAARSDDAFRHTYAAELEKSLQQICTGLSPDQSLSQSPDPRQFQEAIAFMALCVGGLALSRAVADKTLSDDILNACTAAAGRLAQAAD